MTSQKIRIADLVNTDYGAYRLLRTRVQKIEQDENFVNYIVCPAGEWSEKMKKQGIKVINVNLSNSLKINEVLHEIKDLEKVFKEYKIDIVHTHTSKPGVTGRIAAKKAKVPLVIHQVHTFHFMRYNGIRRFIFEKIEKHMASYANFMLFQNKDEFEFCLKNKYSKKTVLKYIGNGISFEEFDNYLNKEKNYNPGQKNIACIARLEEVKNHKMLFRSLKYLIEVYNYTDFKLNLYGEGEEEIKLKEFAKSLNIESFVNFVGTLDRKEMIDSIFQSDLSVLTSYKEGKPRALMESSALGVPIVATDVIGTREVVKNGKTGYLVKLNDYESFAEKMYELLTNEKKWAEFSKNAKEVAAEEFNEDNVVRQLKELYYSLKNNKNYNKKIASGIN